MATLKEQLMAILVCDQCGAPVEFDPADKVYRHKEPLDRFCKRNGYPVETKVRTS